MIAIWEVGLPLLESVPATEQRRSCLQANATSILQWLDKIATAFQEYQATTAYQKANRKAGTIHGKSGLTPDEQDKNMALAKARQAMRRGRNLVRRWNQYELTWTTATHAQRDLLHAYWNGNLEIELRLACKARGYQKNCLPLFLT